MVDATVDNKPVSIVLDGLQSTTVPSNETWQVSIHLAVNDLTRMSIDSVGTFRASSNESSANTSLDNVTLTGGQTVTVTANKPNSCIFITGFVVNS